MRSAILILALSAVVMTARVETMTFIPSLSEAVPHYGNPWAAGSSTPHCRSDELLGHLLAPGKACFPKTTNNACPTDFPAGTTAKPFPLVQDSQGNKYCVLICEGYAIGTCPSGSTCVQPSGSNLGISLQAQVPYKVCLYANPTLSTIKDQ